MGTHQISHVQWGNSKKLTAYHMLHTSALPRSLVVPSGMELVFAAVDPAALWHKQLQFFRINLKLRCLN